MPKPVYPTTDNEKMYRKRDVKKNKSGQQAEPDIRVRRNS